MMGLGTIINILGVLLGGGLGLLLKKGLPEKIRRSLIRVQGLVVIVLGLSGALEKLGARKNDALFLLIALVAGSLLGELMDLEGHLERGAARLRDRYARDEEGFVQGFLLASLTMCLGAMGILGALEDALFGDIRILLTKSLLDSFTAFMLASFYGPGVLFSILPLGLWQGSFTLLAGILAPFLTEGVLQGVSLTGSLMILAIGINLLFDEDLPLVSMLPALPLAGLLGLLS